MAETSSPSDSLDRLCEEFVERSRRGEDPSVEEYAERYPQHAAEIRELFPKLLGKEHAAPEGGLDETMNSERFERVSDQLERLGEYRILREIGRGGMGVVYEAEQESLGRHVALKILPKQLLSDSKERKRFIREARAAARLHHTNIVPVFGIGEADGVSFYAMQYIKGMPLNDVLREVRRTQRLAAGEALGNDEKNEGDATVGAEHDPDATGATLAQSMIDGNFTAPYNPITSDSLDQTLDSGQETPACTVDVNMRDSMASEATERTSVYPHSKTGAFGKSKTSMNAFDKVVGEISSTSRRSGAAVPPGHELSKFRDRGPTTYWHSVARIGRQAADALGYAHGQGIIHRDIKPGNLLLDSAGTVWITDFGLAKADDQDDLTKTGDVLGTLRYMPPEALSGQADERSDIFSLGLTLYELLAQQPAYNERNRSQLLPRITNANVVRLRSLVPGIPRDLETVVHKSLAADPKDRYERAGEMADDLERYLNDEPIRARRMSLMERFVRWSRRNPVITGLGVACLLLLITVSIVSSTAYVHTSNALDLVTQKEREAGLARDKADVARAEAEATTYRRNVLLALAQWREGHAGTGVELLEECPVGRRNVEWRICRRLFHQYEWKQRVSANDITLSPDEQTFALAVFRSGISIRNTMTGEEIRRIDISDVVRTVDFHPNDDLLIVCGDSCVLRVLQPDGTVVREKATSIEKLVPYGEGIFSPDGKMFALVGNGKINLQVFSWPDLETLWESSGAPLDERNQTSRTAVFTPDSLQILTSSEKSGLFLWDAQKGPDGGDERAPRHFDPGYDVTNVDMHPDGKRVLLGGTGAVVKLMSLVDGSTRVLGRHRGVDSPGAVRFLVGQELAVSAGTDNSLLVWNLRSQAVDRALVGHERDVLRVACLADGSLISCGRVAAIRWSPPAEAESHHDQRIAFHPTEPWMARYQDDQVQYRQIDDGSPAPHPELTVYHAVETVRFSPDGCFLILSGPKGGTVWRWEDGKRMMVFDDPMVATTGYKQPGPFLTADGMHLLYIRKDGQLVVRNVATGDALPVPEALRCPTRFRLAVAPRTRLAAAVYGDTIKVFDPISGKVEQSINTYVSQNGVAAFSPDEKFLLMSHASHIDVYDVQRGEKVNELAGHWRAPSALAFSADETRLVSGGTDAEVRIWEWPSGRPLLHLDSEHRVSAVQLDSRGHWLQASGYLGVLDRLWDARPEATTGLARRTE